MSEVIIDGVNVAECELLQRLYNSSNEIELYWCEKKNIECQDICDCYFKQLQRLKAENKLLKGTIKDINITMYFDKQNQ